MPHELHTANAFRPPADRPWRLLVADADEDTRALYRQLLHGVGCDVIEAADGRDALEKALVRQPSVVVTELFLPFVDGFALCEILRRDRMTAGVPIIIVTSETRQTQIDRVRGAGADVVLVKPTSADVLLREIDRLIERPKAQPTPSPRGVPLAASPRSHNARRMAKVRAHSRLATTTPPVLPPILTCPSCDQPLAYAWSHVGGVSDQHSEQWDYLLCSRCGAYQYRQRTRKLQGLSRAEAEWVVRMKT